MKDLCKAVLKFLLMDHVFIMGSMVLIFFSISKNPNSFIYNASGAPAVQRTRLMGIGQFPLFARITPVITDVFSLEIFERILTSAGTKFAVSASHLGEIIFGGREGASDSVVPGHESGVNAVNRIVDLANGMRNTSKSRKPTRGGRLSTSSRLEP